MRTPIFRLSALVSLGLLVGTGCGKDDRQKRYAKEVNETAPYLTADVEVLPVTGLSDTDTVTYTVHAHGPTGLASVAISLTPVAQGTGFPDQADALLEEVSADVWTGEGVVDATGGIVVGGDGYYARITLVADTSGASQAGTNYFLDHEISTTRYSFVQFDESGAILDMDQGKSKYDIVFALFD